MNRNLHWDDLNLALAIGETGTLSAAGRKLGVSHATVYRRLNQVEDRLGVSLFQRDRNGFVPTDAGEELIKAARGVEDQVLTVERHILGKDLKPSGTVRITTTDTLFDGMLSPILTGFGEKYPDITLEIAISNQVLNLSRREADIALRPATSPAETLVGRKVSAIEIAVYASKGRKEPKDTTDWPTQDWIGPDERMFYRELEQWMATNDLDRLCRYRVDTVMGMIAAVRNGLGLAALPCYLADRDAKLTRVSAPIPELTVDLWLLTHPDLRHTARIRAVLDYITDEMKT
ncbi:LysR family transcriptional regulator [Aestuariispira ectoiniformans]|uniref:LysR family transcriptional regulator n=1 Tax=Aestuariispira ectoiniformans TaxID=2775080 RepID=UPI00223B1A86|nr:LysR family transcriptional regulator [Aestuariispira ectoiniformans]